MHLLGARTSRLGRLSNASYFLHLKIGLSKIKSMCCFLGRGRSKETSLQGRAKVAPPQMPWVRLVTWQMPRGWDIRTVASRSSQRRRPPHTSYRHQTLRVQGPCREVTLLRDPGSGTLPQKLAMGVEGLRRSRKQARLSLLVDNSSLSVLLSQNLFQQGDEDDDGDDM